jgi:hypothetical protein
VDSPPSSSGSARRRRQSGWEAVVGSGSSPSSKSPRGTVGTCELLLLACGGGTPARRQALQRAWAKSGWEDEQGGLGLGLRMGLGLGLGVGAGVAAGWEYMLPMYGTMVLAMVNSLLCGLLLGPGWSAVWGPAQADRAMVMLVFMAGALAVAFLASAVLLRPGTSILDT